MRVLLILLALLATTALPAYADDEAGVVHLSIKNQHFVPSQLNIPAGQKVKILIKNEDAQAAEFESFKLNREKVVPANSEITVYVGPVDAGAYDFFNDFEPAKTQDTIIAK